MDSVEAVPMHEAGRLLGISQPTLRRLVQSGQLHPFPSPLDRRKKLIPVAELARFLPQTASQSIGSDEHYTIADRSGEASSSSRPFRSSSAGPEDDDSSLAPLAMQERLGSFSEDDPDSLYILARSLRGMRRHAEALHVLEALFRTATGTYAVYHNAAILAESLNNLSLAVQLYERALSLNSEDVDVQVAYADCLSKIPGRTDEAGAIFGQLLNDQRNAKNPKVISMHTDHLMRQHKVGEARLSLDQLAAVAHESLDGARLYLNDLTGYHDDLGLTQDEYTQKLEDFTHSLDRLREKSAGGLVRKVDLGALYAQIATRLADLDRIEEATDNYITAISLDVTDALTLGNFATDLRQRYKQPDLALALWRIALQKRPGNDSLWKQLISALAFSESISPDILYKLVLTPPGSERLSLLNEALGPIGRDLPEILAEVKTILSAKEPIVAGVADSGVIPIGTEEEDAVEETETGKILPLGRKKAV